METNPGKILQMHGIEISPCERRTTEEVVKEYIERGIIIVMLDSTLEQPKNEV